MDCPGLWLDKKWIFSYVMTGPEPYRGGREEFTCIKKWGELSLEVKGHQSVVVGKQRIGKSESRLRECEHSEGFTISVTEGLLRIGGSIVQLEDVLSFGARTLRLTFEPCMGGSFRGKHGPPMGDSNVACSWDQSGGHKFREGSGGEDERPRDPFLPQESPGVWSQKCYHYIRM